MTERARTLLAETAAAWGLVLTAAQLDQFTLYTEELQRWNDRVNLTAITSAEDIVVRHMLDALRCARSWGDAPASLADIGSGGGFPGLPLKLLRPSLRLILVESIGKKAAFLHHIVGVLGLHDVAVLTRRAEEVGHDSAHRERYDVVVARAVAELRTLAEYCLPLARVGGRFLAPKGAAVAEEVAVARRALALLGGKLQAVEPVTLPGLEPRTLVVIEKVQPTPAAYPRSAGVPSRRPL